MISVNEHCKGNRLNKHIKKEFFNPFMTEAFIIQKLCKSMDWFLYDIGLRHEKIKKDLINLINT